MGVDFMTKQQAMLLKTYQCDSNWNVAVLPISEVMGNIASVLPGWLSDIPSFSWPRFSVGWSQLFLAMWQWSDSFPRLLPYLSPSWCILLWFQSNECNTSFYLRHWTVKSTVHGHVWAIMTASFTGSQPFLDNTYQTFCPFCFISGS